MAVKQAHQRSVNRRCMRIGSVQTPQLGDVWVAFSERGLVAVEFGVRRNAFEASVRKQTSAEVELASGDAAAEIADATRQLAEYLDASRRTFELRIDWSVL